MGNPPENQSPDRNTRFIDTTLGVLSYSQLAPHLAERVANVSLEIENGVFDPCPLDETLLLELHRRICGDIVPDWAGRWRSVDVRVGNLKPPNSHQVPTAMRDYCADLRARWEAASGSLGPLTLEFLAFAEGRFLTIHPFADFNGRVIRLFLHELLRRLDLPLLEIEAKTPELREKYFAALEAADQFDWQPLIRIGAKRLEGGEET
jgi:CRISPR-associated endonuclease/helicase Cas3